VSYVADRHMTCDKGCGVTIKPGDLVYNVPARAGDVAIMAAHVKCPGERA
jgi:hypothetical protein